MTASEGSFTAKRVSVWFPSRRRGGENFVQPRTPSTRSGSMSLHKGLNQIAQHGTGEPVLVRPLRIAKDAEELVGIVRLDGPHRGLKRRAHVLFSLPHLAPAHFGRNLKTMLLPSRCVAF